MKNELSATATQTRAKPKGKDYTYNDAINDVSVYNANKERSCHQTENK